MCDFGQPADGLNHARFVVRKHYAGESNLAVRPQRNHSAVRQILHNARRRLPRRQPIEPPAAMGQDFGGPRDAGMLDR